MKVLLIDDERVIAHTGAQILQKLGHQAQAAYGGDNALEVAEKLKPDVCFVGVVMDEDSISLARELKKRLPGVRLISWVEDQPEHFKQSGLFEAHLSAPFNPQDLLALIGTNRQG